MNSLAALATRHAGRPLLLTRDAALTLAMQIRNIDGRAFERPGRLEAFLRRVGLAGGRGVRAWDDDDDYEPPPPIEQRLAYSPRWLGEPEDTGYCWSLKNNVALMSVDTPLVARGEEFCGTVYHGYDTLLVALREVAGDDRARGTFMHLNTPGGVVDGGLFALGDFMRKAREAAGGKPIWVYADQACSAGYWIAAQADRIIAPEVGYVGSIGAVIVHEDHSEALKEDGIAVTPFTFGEEKVDGAWWQALTESARASFTADVTQCGNRFVDEVIAGRPSFTREALLATRARVYMGRHADPERSGEAVGFTDAIMSEEEAFAELVAHVSTAPKTISTPTPAATGSRAAPISQEEPMAISAKTKAAQAAAQRKTSTLRAQLARAEKEEKDLAKAAEDEAADDEEDDEEVDGAPAAVDPDDEDKDPDAVDPDDEDDKDDAAAIAASAQAKTHPNLALAAIQSKQTLAQFKANVAAAGEGARVSKLDSVMKGSRRLGADGGKPQGKGGDNAFSAAMAARAKQHRG